VEKDSLPLFSFIGVLRPEEEKRKDDLIEMLLIVILEKVQRIFEGRRGTWETPLHV
jgi:hypothetical protein